MRFVNRKGWEPGPWDSEPDVVHEPPILLHRQSNGGWGAMVAIEKQHKDAAAHFIQKQGRVKLDNRQHRLSLVEFDKASAGAKGIDIDRLYIGFFYDRPGDMRPAGTKYVRELPEYMRTDFMRTARGEYVTAQRARMYAEILASVLQGVGIPPIDASA